MKDLFRGYFVERLNRFVVRLHLFEPCGECIEAYLPNPGRLWELFYKGTELILEKGNPGSKYNYVVIGVYKNDRVVFLHTLRNNDLAEHLLKNKLVHGLEDYRILKREAPSPLGKSRFDFLLEKEGEPCYLEVKSCSLFQGDMAMFPDAPTLRGKRHLLELKELHEQGYNCAVLIIIQDDQADNFLPEYHTDPEFATAFLQCREAIQFYAVGSTMNRDMLYPSSVKELTIPWEILEKENKDRGHYILILEIQEDFRKMDQDYPKGFYLMTGYTERGLQALINRVLRKRNPESDAQAEWRSRAATAKALAIRSSRNLTEELEKAMGQLLKEYTSILPEKLYYALENPIHSKDFIEKLLQFRMEQPLTYI